MANLKQKSGLTVFLGLSFLPAIIWLFLLPLSWRFTGLAATTTSIGQVLGLIGMAMFSLVLVLAARFKFLEDYFGGLNRVYLSHHFWGGVSFVLLLLHPLFLAVKYALVSMSQAGLFFVPSNNAAINYGIFSLTIMAILMALTFLIKLPYEHWKRTHKFMGLAYFLAASHVFLVPGDLSASPLLRYYMMALAAAALFSILYRSVFGIVLVKKFKFRVETVRRLNPKVLEIELKSEGKIMASKPGQFVFVSFIQPGLSREVHPFSIVSASGNILRLAVKILGDYTASLVNLHEGSRARVEGPFGRFSFLAAESKEQLWVAGGIGITPFLSLASSLADHPDYEVTLVYCLNNQSEAVYLEELKALADRYTNFHFTVYYSQERGRLTADALAKLSSGLASKDIFLCGPEPMMKSLRQQLNKLEVPDQRIHSEEFNIK